MADQNDNNDDLVGLPDFHDKNEDAPVDSLDWRDVLHEHLKVAVGKTYSFRLPRGEQVPLYALKPSAFAPSAEEAKRVFDEIMAHPSTVVLFEDGEPTESIAEYLAKMPVPDAPNFGAHYEILGREIGKETARQHNERKYPDLVRRIDRLANRPLNDEDDK